MGTIIRDEHSANVVVCRGAGDRATGSGRWLETTLKPAPGNPLRVEQISDIWTAHSHGRSLRATIIGWISIANQRAVGDHIGERGWRSSMGLTRDQIERSWSRGVERGSKRVITHRKMLSVVPECCHCIAIVVVHHDVLVGAA